MKVITSGHQEIILNQNPYVVVKEHSDFFKFYP